jgi:hypothetical protein
MAVDALSNAWRGIPIGVSDGGGYPRLESKHGLNVNRISNTVHMPLVLVFIVRRSWQWSLNIGVQGQKGAEGGWET